MNLELLPHERDYFAARYKDDPARTIQYAEKTAREYVTTHAGEYLPSIQYGLFRLVIQYYMQPDAGERRNLRFGMNALIDLGRLCHDIAARN